MDAQFAGRSATEATIAATTQAIGLTQAALRAAHLKYHLATNEVLMPAQTQRYMDGALGQQQHGGHRH